MSEKYGCLGRMKGNYFRKTRVTDVHDSRCMAITALVPAARAELREGKKKKEKNHE